MTTLIHPDIIMVDVVVPDNYPTIQAAINAAPVDRTSLWEILVMNGVYPAPNVLSNFIKVKAESRDVILRMPAWVNGVDTILFRGQDVHDIVLEGMTLDTMGVPVNYGSYGVALKNVQNVTLRNLKVVNIRAAALSMTNFKNALVEDCEIDKAWTGVLLNGGSDATVRLNRVTNTGGDGIFPRSPDGASIPCADLRIEDNYLENIGDTGVDVTSSKTMSTPAPHRDIVVKGNTFKNAHIRVSFAEDIQLLNNTLSGGKAWVDLDGGAGVTRRILVSGNTVESSQSYVPAGKPFVGIGCYGIYNSDLISNKITMLPGRPGETQAAIHAAIRGTSNITDNWTLGGDYSLSFGNWGLGGNLTSMVIRRHQAFDFRKYGLWDDGKSQPRVTVEDGQMNSALAEWAVYAPASKWTVINNGLTVGTKTGDDAVKALLGSTISGNKPYDPCWFRVAALEAQIRYLNAEISALTLANDSLEAQNTELTMKLQTAVEEALNCSKQLIALRAGIPPIIGEAELNKAGIEKIIQDLKALGA